MSQGPLFLTPEELEDFTGYARQADQVRWLQDRRYLYELNAKGLPKVLRAHVVARLGGTLPPTDRTEPQLHLR